MAGKIKISKKQAISLGGFLVTLALVVSYVQTSFFVSDVFLSPGDVFNERVNSLPNTSFLILILAAVAVVILGIAGVIFLIVGLSDKD